jgi:hypothetical protein
MRSVDLPTSKVKLRGILTVRVRDASTGRVIRTVIKKNTITYNGGNNVRALLAQRATDDPPAQLAFGSMRFGRSTTAPNRNDVDLLDEVVTVRKQLQDSDKVNGIDGELTLQATLGSGDGNGNTFTEAGLFSTGPAWNGNVGSSLRIFSRQLHAAIAKNSAIVLDYSWTIQIATV